MRTLFFVFSLFNMWASACQVPVFRYALERWPADRYRVVLVVDPAAELLPEAQATLHTAEAIQHANLTVRRAVPGELDLPPGTALPAIALQFPAAMLRDDVIWSAPLQRKHLKSLLDSPARRTLATRALAGDTATWVLLESGNDEVDRRVLSALRRHLDTAEAELQLPEGIIGKGNEVPEGGDPENELQSDIPLHLKFSIVRLSANDPVESVLRSMLLSAEAGLEDRWRDEPLLFAVFGQGRSLPALFAGDVSEESILFGCNYLCGACSCKVKRENPGFDLLLTCDWDAALAGIGSAIPEKFLPPLTGVILPHTAASAMVSEDETMEPPAPGHAPHPFRGLAWVLLLVVLGVVAGTLRILKR